jgi:hypothetical protein
MNWKLEKKSFKLILLTVGSAMLGALLEIQLSSYLYNPNDFVLKYWLSLATSIVFIAYGVIESVKSE